LLVLMLAAVAPAVQSFVAISAAFGPRGALRCLSDGAYTYDPRRDEADRRIMADPLEPTLTEALLAEPLWAIEIERVEVDLHHSGTTLIRIRYYHADGGRDERVLVLVPSSYRFVGQPICAYDLRQWRIIAEQALG
jgi:hypothetical protein